MQVTGWADRKQSRQGPWSLCSWNSSSSRAASLEAATTRSSPRGSASSSPAAETSSNSTLRVVSTCRKSMRSKSATMVSVSSTKVADRSCPSIRSLSTKSARPAARTCGGVPQTSERASRLVTQGQIRIRNQPQAARYDVAGDIGQLDVVDISIGPQPNERVGDVDVELLGEHAGGLVDLRPIRTQVRRPLMGVQEQQGSGIGEDQRVAELVVTQRAGPVPVEAKRPGPDRPDHQREHEHRGR